MAAKVAKDLILPAVILIAGFATVIFLNPRIEGAKPRLPETFSDTDLGMNGSRLKGFAFGMEGLLADWYWIRALQYIGDKVLKRKGEKIDMEDLTPLNPRLLYPLLKNATDLDPHFIGAYSYGAVVLPAIDKERAVELAEAGIANNPEEWRLYQHLGYVYWKLGRFDRAAETYERGARIPGASPFMALMGAAMRSEGGSRSTARAIYTQMLADSTDPSVSITAERRLMELDWFDERDAINAALTAFSERTGRCPATFGEAAPLLLQARLPGGKQLRIDAASRLVDPSGVPYKLDTARCVVRLDVERTQLPSGN